MEAAHRLDPAAERRRMAGRVRKISDHSAVSADEPRHDARRVQAYLLVGMDAPAARPVDRRCVPAPVPVVPLARRQWAGPARAALDGLRSRLTGGRRRLVDGGLRPGRPGECLAVSARVPSHARLRDLYVDPVDGPAPAAATGA